ncbi:hypothetical protein V6N13_025395 [Hibiscus sabdariffa]
MLSAHGIVNVRSLLAQCGLARLNEELNESLDGFRDDEENIVPITKKDDVHLLDVDDVEIVITNATEGNCLDVEDDVWSAAVSRLGLENDKSVWDYVGPETEQPIPNYPAYEPPSHMYDVNYTAIRDREYEARVFGSSSSSNYGELVLEAHFETKKKLIWQLRSTILNGIRDHVLLSLIHKPIV